MICRIVIFMVCFCAMWTIPLIAESSDIFPSESNPVSSESQAISRVVQWTGGNSIAAGSGSGRTMEAATGTHQDSTTPFIGQLISNRSVWRVSVVDSTIEKRQVWVIDSATGVLIEARLTPLIDTLLCYMEPLAADAEHYLATMGETYDAFVDAQPKISVFEALDGRMFSLSAAGLTIVRYVMYNRRGLDQTIPAWVIEQYNLPPFGRDKSQSHWRTVVSAETGQPCMSGTFPFPRRVDDSRCAED